MIKSFAHKGLEKFYKTGSKAGIQANHAEKLSRILDYLDVAESPDDMDFPGLALHEFQGDRAGIWTVSVSGNWRVTSRFAGSDVEIVNYEDYH
ncbi:MAG: type II toxin-antitoxin system RelE/ParE family toxin [Candidatus Aquicultorales bacterium]